MNNNIRTIFIITGIVILVIYAFVMSDFQQAAYKSKLEKATEEKINEFDITNELSKENKYSVKSVVPEEMAKMYYNDYKNMIINYPDEAYEIILNKEDFSEEDFQNYRNQLINDYYSNSYSTYSYYQEQTTNCYVYRVTNNKGETFTFKTYAVMNYGVNISLE